MELLTSKELCECLSVSYMTLYRMMQKGLPCIVLGSRDAVMEWLRTSSIAERKEGKV